MIEKQIYEDMIKKYEQLLTDQEDKFKLIQDNYP